MAIRNLGVFDEGEYLQVKVRFEDENHVARIPATARWNLYCMSNDRLVLDWQVVSVTSSEVTVEIPSGANEIIRESNVTEKKLLTVQANYDTDEMVPKSCMWTVKNSPAY